METARIVERPRLVELLHHDDLRVREESAQALERFFPGAAGVIPHLLAAIDRAPGASLPLAAGIHAFTPDAEDLRRIVTLLQAHRPGEESGIPDLGYHLEQALLAFPFSILERSAPLFSADPRLAAILEASGRRERVRARDADTLWAELETLSGEQEADEKPDAEKTLRTRLLVEGLARHGEAVRPRVVRALRQPELADGMLELHLVELAGELKLEAAVPSLFRIFFEADNLDLVHDACSRALGRIGTAEVVEEVGRRYPTAAESHRGGLSAVLGCIATGRAEDIALRLLLEEKQRSERTFLAGALCDLFSWKGVGPIRDLIRSREYDPTIMSLVDHLVPVYAYHRQSFDELLDLEQVETSFREQEWRSSPLFEMGRKLRALFDESRVNPPAAPKPLPYIRVQPVSKKRRKKRR